ncbi:MAG TPA: hypothetical protein VMD59_10165, partial [Acidimicrobiales bacterium]|nr:hypothetical protein [Acidimicrobiales bacterium]
FVKLKGSLQVLIVGISVELDLSLTYQSGPNGSEVTGTATLKVSISICFFSITIPITVTKTWGGGGSSSGPEMSAGRERSLIDPPMPIDPVYFTDIVPDQSTWQQYCAAFAG